MKYFYIAIISLVSQLGWSQPQEGAIKTSQGFLLFYSDDKNSYTLDLRGDIDLFNPPLIRQNDTWFGLDRAVKSEGEQNDQAVLSRLMAERLAGYEHAFGQQLTSQSEATKVRGKVANFWQIKMPQLRQRESIQRVKTTYFFDFVHQDLVIRLSYPSKSGKDMEARQLFLTLLDAFTFYTDDIDLNRLQQSIQMGVNSY